MLKKAESPNFDERNTDAADILVMHYTGMKTAKEALGRMCSKEAKVSAHYMIDEDGTVFQLVEEKNRAWHAGISFWKGITDINSHSIGIEIVNPGHEFGYRPFPDIQMESVIKLAKEIITRHPIKPENIVGHSDIAPLRKEDPGELFNWKLLAENGIGIWEDEKQVIQNEKHDYIELLKNIGYDTSSDEIIKASVLAFQRHFLPENLTGKADKRTINRISQIHSLYASI